MPVLADGETPVARAFRAWEAHRAWLNGPAIRGMKDEDYDLSVEALDDKAATVLKAPALTPQDFILKVIAGTDYGSGGLPDSNAMPDLWAEARSLIGGLESADPIGALSDPAPS